MRTSKFQCHFDYLLVLWLGQIVNGHKFFPSLYASPPATWLCHSYNQEVGLFLHPLNKNLVEHGLLHITNRTLSNITPAETWKMLGYLDLATHGNSSTTMSTGLGWCPGGWVTTQSEDQLSHSPSDCQEVRVWPSLTIQPMPGHLSPEESQ